MSVLNRNELKEYLTNLLSPEDYDDLCPNGLQVQGKNEINKIITGVSGCVELFEKAIEKDADAIIVHHGIIWNFERPTYKGSYKKRVKLLLKNDINLFGFHLPLDANEKVGNNAVIANKLGLENRKPFGEFKGTEIGLKGKLNIKADDFFSLIKDKINPEPLIFDYGPENIQNIGIISGGADKNVKEAVSEDLDLFLTGEVSEHIMHYVKEENIHFVGAGHHATERFGIRELGDRINEKFNVEVEFIDIPNPV